MSSNLVPIYLARHLNLAIGNFSANPKASAKAKMETLRLVCPCNCRLTYFDQNN